MPIQEFVEGRVQDAGGNPVGQGAERPKMVDGIALSLSGGGYRATLFHLGAIWRLNEMGYLKRIERISSVSGGSILAGFLGARWHQLRFENGVATNFESVIVEPVRRFCGRPIDIAAFLIGCLPFVRPSDVLAGFYRLRFLGSAKLKDFPEDQDGPRFVLNATSLQTGADARFSRPYIADYKVGVYRGADTTIARAVAASSGFPPFFSPVVVRLKGGTWDVGTEGTVAKDLDKLRRRMILCDGGVYDNLGIQTVGKYRTLLVSDAGAPSSTEPDGAGALFSMASGGLRVVFLMLAQLQARRKYETIADAKARAHEGVKRAYWDIATKIDDYGVATPLTHDNAVTAALQKTRTRLNHFNPKEQGQLINWGYALADASVRRWVDAGAPAATSWPVPEYPLD